MNIVKKKISELIPADYNPRKDLKPSDPEYQKIKRSIEKFGCVEPLVWNKRSKRIVGGHQRIKVLQELGIKEIEISVVDLPVEEEKALNIALNKIGGEFDEVKLEDLFKELSLTELDLSLTGFDEIDFNMPDIEIPDNEIKYTPERGKMTIIFPIGEKQIIMDAINNLEIQDLKIYE